MGWGTDQIASSNLLDFDNKDIFLTESKIPMDNMNFGSNKIPNPFEFKPGMQAKISPPHQKGVEGFSNYGKTPQITENMLIIILLVILIVMCTMIYSSVKQTCETIKLMVTILAAKKN